MSPLSSLSLCWRAQHLLVACYSEPPADDADESQGSRSRSSLPGVPFATATPTAGAGACRRRRKPSPPPSPTSMRGAGFETSAFAAAPPPSCSSSLDPLERLSPFAGGGGGVRSGSGGGALPRGAAAGAPVPGQGSIAGESVFSLAAGRASPALSRSGSRPILQPMPLPPLRAGLVGLRSSRSMTFSKSLTGLSLGRARSTSTAGLPALAAAAADAVPPSHASGRGGSGGGGVQLGRSQSAATAVSAGSALGDKAAGSIAGAASLQQRLSSGSGGGSSSLLLASHDRVEGSAIIRAGAQPRGLPSSSGGASADSSSASNVASDCGSAQPSLAPSTGSSAPSAARHRRQPTSVTVSAFASSSHLAAAAAAELGTATDDTTATKPAADGSPARGAVAAADSVGSGVLPSAVGATGGGGAAAVLAAAPGTPVAGAVQQVGGNQARPRSAFSDSAANTGNGTAGGTVEERKVAVGWAFGRAFVRALLAGNPKWASNPALSGLFAESARMVTHDKQRFEGRTAIIRRLNAGMEQFLKAIGHQQQQPPTNNGAGAPMADNAAPQPAPSSTTGRNDAAAPGDPTSTADGPASASSAKVPLSPPLSADGAAEAAAVASDHDLAMQAAAVGISYELKAYLQSIAAVGTTSKGGVRQQGAGAGIGALMARGPGRVLRSLAAKLWLGKAGTAIAGGGSGGGSGGSMTAVAGPAVVVVEYNFKMGMRRFRLQDQMVVSAQGRITRLKRLRP